MDKDVPAVADALPPVFSPEQVERDNPPTTDVTVRPLRQYTNEARAYHSRYTELSEAHDSGNYNYCREGCLDLLMEPRMPIGTRVQILQMLSTLVGPTVAESYIQEAASILAQLDQRNFQVQLLTGDNEKMQRDLDDVQNPTEFKKEEKRKRDAEFDRVLEEQREIARAAEEEVESWGPEDTDLVFFPDDGGEHRRAQEDKEAQITKFQEEVVARKKQRLQFGGAQAERLDPGYSIFSGVSAVQDENAGASFQDSSFFSGLSDADGTSPQASPGESMMQDGSRSGTSATGRPHTSASSRPGTSAGNRRDTSIGGDIAGINTILAKDSAAHEATTTEAATTKAATAKANEAAINTARAQVEAGRMELAALESKLTAIREDKTADVVQHLPIRSKYPADIGIGRPMQENDARDDVGEKKGIRKMSARALSIFGLGEKKGKKASRDMVKE